MAQQTALQFLIEELKGYEYDGNDFIFTGIISSELIEQAKQMEKEQHQETFKQSRQAKIFEEGMPPVWESFEQYYNETFSK